MTATTWTYRINNSHGATAVIPFIEQKSRLLDLAPELRNRIYEYALIGSRRLAVVQAFRPPGLIQTCAQIRYETKQLWVAQNTFSMTIKHCNVTLAARFQTAIQATCCVRPQMSFRMRGKCNWKNLMDWCEKVHRGETTWFEAKIEAKHMSAVVAAATKMAATPGSNEIWQALREDLEAWRKVVGMIRSEWLDE